MFPFHILQFGWVGLLFSSQEKLSPLPDWTVLGHDCHHLLMIIDWSELLVGTSCKDMYFYLDTAMETEPRSSWSKSTLIKKNQKNPPDLRCCAAYRESALERLAQITTVKRVILLRKMNDGTFTMSSNCCLSSGSASSEGPGLCGLWRRVLQRPC